MVVVFLRLAVQAPQRWFNTRTGIYGWAFYFGSVEGPIDEETWLNVCIRCGSGSSAAFLLQQHLVRSILPGFRTFRCPKCGASIPSPRIQGTLQNETLPLNGSFRGWLAVDENVPKLAASILVPGAAYAPGGPQSARYRTAKRQRNGADAARSLLISSTETRQRVLGK